MAFKFEKLMVWQKAVDLATQIHLLTLNFPKDELYVLTSQMKRAADSISLNIAEASTGQTNPEFKRFLNIALRSCIEVVGCLHLAIGRNILNETILKEYKNKCEEIVVMINGLKKTLS